MNLLETKGLVKTYGDRRVVDGLSISVGRGEIVGLLGPNGAGKTTSFYMTVGIVKPTEGSIFFDQEDITSKPIHKRCSLGMGYLAQESSIFKKMTVEENIIAILETLDISPCERKKRLQSLLGDLNIAHLAKARAYTLSGGEMRRLEITRALVTNPSFLLLDEPFSGIDPIVVAEAQEIIKGLRDRGLGILLTDHNVRETLAITDRSYLIANGRVVISGTAEDLVNNAEAKRVYLGEQFTI